MDAAEEVVLGAGVVGADGLEDGEGVGEGGRPVFLSESEGGFQVVTSGDLLPFQRRPVSSRTPVVPLTVPAGTSLTVYVRQVSEGTLSFALTLWTVAEDGALLGVLSMRDLIREEVREMRDYIALNHLERIRDIFEHLGAARDAVVV